MSKLRLLVTGASSQVGVALCARAASAEMSVVWFDDSILNNLQLDSIQAAISTYKPHYVVNTASYSVVDLAQQNPQQNYASNRDVAMVLAQACEGLNLPLLHLSTDYVFDGVASSPYKEDEQTNPQGVYGKTKLLGELAIIQSGCKYVIIRTAWVFSEYGDNFLKTMLRLGSDRETLSIIYDQIGCPTYAQDLAQAITCIIIQFDLKNVKSGIYHYCGNKACSWFDFATIIFLAAKNEGYRVPECLTKITLAEYRALSERPLYSALDCSKIKTEFGIQPSDWSKGIRSAIKAL